MFTKKELELLKLIIGNGFYDTTEYSRELIDISKKLGLDENFIQELENDFKSNSYE